MKSAKAMVTAAATAGFAACPGNGGASNCPTSEGRVGFGINLATAERPASEMVGFSLLSLHSSTPEDRGWGMGIDLHLPLDLVTGNLESNENELPKTTETPTGLEQNWQALFLLGLTLPVGGPLWAEASAGIGVMEHSAQFLAKDGTTRWLLRHDSSVDPAVALSLICNISRWQVPLFTKAGAAYSGGRTSLMLGLGGTIDIGR